MARGFGATAVTGFAALLAPSDHPAQGTFEAIYRALDASSHTVIGPAQPRLLVIPLHDDAGAAAGGLWGCTLSQWLHVQLLFVPEALRGRSLGAALLASAETEARRRGCLAALSTPSAFRRRPSIKRWATPCLACWRSSRRGTVASSSASFSMRRAPSGLPQRQRKTPAYRVSMIRPFDGSTRSRSSAPVALG